MDGKQPAMDRHTAEGRPEGMPPQGGMPGGMPPQGKMPGGMPPHGGMPGGMPPHGRMFGGMPPHGKMPGGMPPDPQMMEVHRAIMPDFPRWRTAFFRVDCGCVALTAFLGIVLFCYFNYMGLIKGQELQFFLFHALLPLVLHLLILGGAAVLRKRMPETDMRQNAIPVFALVLINLVVCLSHTVFIAALATFCIPICMTTVFSNKKFCWIVTNASIASVVIGIVKEYFFGQEPMQRDLVIPQGLIMICILLIMGIVAQVALSMTDGQKQKLFNYALFIKEAQQRAEAANVAKSAFLANMSHEIRTPINAILGMNEMILRENKDAQIEEYARNVHSAGNSLLYLVNDVLDISKIESGKLEIVETNYDTASFIHDCFNMVAERAEKKGLELKIECSKELPSQLRGDEVRLRQVVTNLLSNAAKYTEKGSITLAVEGRKEKEQFSLVIEVRDTGVGIKEENLGTLFSQFTRFDLEKNRNIEGTGLGLAISKQLVDLMHGEIKVHSIYGIGSSFSVTVPQQIIDGTPMGDFNERYHDVNQENAEYRQKFEAPDARILVVDDVEVNLKVIVNLLKATHIQVDVAHGGEHCLELTKQTAYDVIFLDHMMPEMDGVETYSRMRKMEDCPNLDTPVIMLTANAISGVREQYLKEGFADYLSKPVSGDRLESMLKKYLPESKIRKAVPEKKVQTDASAQVSETPAVDSQLQELVKRYPKVDTALGKDTCAGSIDVYIDIIKSFASDAKISELNARYDKKDTTNYQILVHGVKSAALSIGFTFLSESARALEDAARNGDWDFITANHQDMIEEYGTAVEAISQAFPE